MTKHNNWTQINQSSQSLSLSDPINTLYVPPTVPLDAVVVLAVLVGQGVGPGRGQQVMGGAADPVLVLGPQGAGAGEALDIWTEGTLAGAPPLAHCAARDHRVLLGAVHTHTRTHTHTHTHTHT